MNWGAIKQAVIDYTHRTDLNSMFATFLPLAEQRIYNGELNAPKVRVAAMRQFATLANGTRPAGFLEAIKVAPEDSPETPLYYRPLDQMPRERWAYTWDGETMVLSEDRGFPVDMTYYAKLTTPVDDTDENWLMANAPNIYISSLLVEFARWSRDDAIGVREAANYASSVGALHSQEKAASMSGSTLRMKTRGLA